MSKLEDAIASFDWSTVRSFGDRSDGIPAALQKLGRPTYESEPDSAGRYIEMTILNDGCLSEACFPVAVCLVAGLPYASPSAQAQALDLLVQIAAADTYGPEHDQIGKLDPQACRRAVAQGFDFYCEVLESSPSYNEKLVCVDLIALCGYHEGSLRSRAVDMLMIARNWPDLQSAAPLIDASLEDLRS